MKNKKTLISAIAAASVLSVATSVSAFASNQAAKNEKKQAENTTAVEETVVEEAAEAEEIVDETAIIENEKPDLPAPPEGELPAPELVEKPEEAPAPEIKDEDAVEAPAEEIAKPAKPIGVKDIKDMIAKSFDFDNADFKDDDAKKDWFDFCNNEIKFDDKKPAELVKPEDAEAPAKPAVEPPVKPEAPVIDENAEKPEPPAPPVIDENAPAPEAPKAPEPPVAPEKPEIKPHEHVAPHHGPHKDIENTQTDEAAETAEETVEEN